MKDVVVKFSNAKEPLFFATVDEFYDTTFYLEIIQHLMYKTVKTRIRKATIDYYKIYE